MEIKWNAGLAPAQIGREVTTAGINSVANGVSQATPAGISAARDIFERTTILGQVSGQSILGGVAPAAHHLSPTAYLKALPLIGNRPESLVQIGTLSGGIGDQKIMDGISKKLTREKLDSLSNHSELSGFDVQSKTPIDYFRLTDMCDFLKAMRDSYNEATKNAISNLRP